MQASHKSSAGDMRRMNVHRCFSHPADKWTPPDRFYGCSISVFVLCQKKETIWCKTAAQSSEDQSLTCGNVGLAMGMMCFSLSDKIMTSSIAHWS